jgi:membrane-bound serine protease (ClpP class)
MGRIAVFCMAVLCSFFARADDSHVVLKLTIHDTVQPVSADYLERGLRAAADRRADLVLISLGTPGGLLDSTRDMVHAIESSTVPVAVYISPSGSRAGSAGFFLLESADVAARAPGTNAGAAHPLIEGAKSDDVLRTKVENDAAAFLRASVTQRGRNVQAAEDAVRSSKSYSDREALDLRLIDLIAADDVSLLTQLDNRPVRRFDGSTTTLHLAGARIVLVAPSLRERILTRLVNPDVAVIVLVLGALLLYVEFNVPGTIIPGSVGVLLILLGIFGLNLLPVRHTAVVLLLGAVCLIALELKYTSHGVLGAIGIVCLVAGLATLVDTPVPELHVHLATAVGAGVAFGGISAALAWIALRAKRSKQLLGPEAMLGLIGTVQTPLCPIGQVEVRGELWRARTADGTPVLTGEDVHVRAVDGLVLVVGAGHPSH